VDGDALTYSLQTGAANGVATVAPDGSYSYTPNADFEGQDSFVALVTDPDGASTTATVTVVIDPRNDTPEITTPDGQDVGTVTEDGEVLTATGALTASDPDLGDTLSWSGSAQGSFGALTVNPDGSWSYTVDPDLVDGLPEGGSVTDVFTATVSDSVGATAQQQITLTILGTNDRPVITSAEVDLTLVETLADDAAYTASGTITAVETDGSDALTFAAGPVTAELTDEDGAPVPAGAENGFTAAQLTAIAAALTVAPDGAWDFNLTGGLGELAQGYTLTIRTQVTATDDSGAADASSLPQDLTITIRGTNDAPVISSDVADATGAITEGVPAADRVSGQLAVSDVDFAATATWTTSDVGAFGTFTLNPDGSWEYVLNQPVAATLAAGVIVTETFTATASDGLGGTVTQEVTVDITGSNTTPVVTSDTAAASGALTEGDETTSISGLLEAVDVDTGDSVTWTLSGPAQGTYGSMVLLASGVWTYTLDNALADALRVGDVVTETFTANVTDVLGATATQSLTITITGTNDLPVLAFNEVIETTVDTAVTGTLTATDVDNAGVTFAADPAGAPANGSVDIAPDGSYTYTPDEGFVGLDTFTYIATDDDGGQSVESVTVEVESDTSADAPVTVAIVTDPSADAAAGSVAIEVDPVVTPGVNLVFALDGSGSISPEDWTTTLTNVAGALDLLADEFEGSATAVSVKLIVFANDVDVSLPATDLLTTDWSTVLGGLIQPEGATNWTAALNETRAHLDQPGVGVGRANYLFFITDGDPTVATGSTLENARDALLDEETNLYSVNIEAFGIGDNIDEENLAFLDTGTDPDGDGPLTSYTILDGPEDLQAALAETPIFNPTLVELQVTLAADGAAAVVVADETSPALQTDGLDYDLAFAEIADISGLLGVSNRFSVSASYDLDGDGTADLDLFSTEVLGRTDTAQTIAGEANSDLIFGSTKADDLSGGGSNDILVGYDGADTLSGGAGQDTVLGGDGADVVVLELASDATGDVIDGGAGRDILDIGFAGDVNAGLLDAAEVTDVEIIDLANGVANTVSLSLADVLDLSVTTDIVLEEALGGPLGAATTIYGDGVDTVNLVDGADGAWTVAASGVADPNGQTLDVYQYVPTGGGAPLATIGLDDDISVNLPTS
jgi:VCBS repeat-containing protein